MVDAPTQQHRDVWVKAMRRLQANMDQVARSCRQVVKTGEGIDAAEDVYEYEARAWAAEQLLVALRTIPTPAVASWDFE